MGIAGQMAAANADKEALAAEYAEVVLAIRGLEKKKEAIKFKLEPLMQPKERVGLVVKSVSDGLDVPADSELLESLEAKYPGITRKELNAKKVREMFKDRPEIEKDFPTKPGYALRVESP